ncbi:hypothetical protein ACWNXI_04410 [Caldibacillus thermoamylovorans]
MAVREFDPFIRNEREEKLVRYAEALASQIAETAHVYDESGAFLFEHFDLLRQEGYLKLTPSSTVTRQTKYLSSLDTKGTRGIWAYFGRVSRRPVKNRCHTPIGGIFIQNRKLILRGFSH